MPYGMTDEEYARFTSGEELPTDEAYRLRELKRAWILGIPPPSAPPAIAPDFHQAMVAAGAPPFAPAAEAPPKAEEASPPLTVSQQPSAAVSPPVALPSPPVAVLPSPPPSLPQLPPPESAPALPPISASIQQLPQQAPVMSQVSPAPAAPAVANINNNVTMPTSTFTPASARPELPKTATPSLAPNLGSYAPAPLMPGYGKPRPGQPFKPAGPSLPTFAAFSGTGLPDFSGLNPTYSPQPSAQQPDDLYEGSLAALTQGRNLFSRY